MKSLLPISLAILFTIPCYSQDLPDYSEKKNELNLGYFNSFQLSSIGELGVGYKRLTDKGAFRTGIQTDLGTSATDLEYYESNYSGFMVAPRIGYEFHQWYNRIRLHFGTDVVGSYRKNTYERLYEDPANNDIETTTAYSAGIRPVLGITVYLNKSISIATETYMDISFSKSSSERLYSDNTITSTSQGMHVGLGPLGIVSINFHF
jgi:hypothetical protein